MKSGQFLIPALIILLAIVSCGKTNSKTKPTLSIKSINTHIPSGGTLDVILDFQSKSSDLSQGTFVAIRNRLNQRPLSSGASSPDTVTGPIPQFPNQQKGQFEFSLDWGTYLHESDTENDTIVFKFAAIDKAGNSSDTIVSPQIIVAYQ